MQTKQYWVAREYPKYYLDYNNETYWVFAKQAYKVSKEYEIRLTEVKSRIVLANQKFEVIGTVQGTWDECENHSENEENSVVHKKFVIIAFIFAIDERTTSICTLHGRAIHNLAGIKHHGLHELNAKRARIWNETSKACVLKIDETSFIGEDSTFYYCPNQWT